MILLKSEKEIEYMRDAGKLVASTLDELRAAVKPGISTIQLDTIAEDHIRSAGAIPAFKGYSGFPASICASINDEVVHGIPGKRRLAEGDIISIDVGVAINGYYGDAAVTIPVGNIQNDIQLLLETTEASLLKGIEKAIVGNRLSDISNAIQTFVEEKNFSVVRDYVGHGIGKSMHEDPQIPNFGPPGRGPRLEAGMTLAIEPMVNMGTYEVSLMKDRWTVVTKDRKPSAHFEHTIAIGFDGPEVLTTI